MYRVTKAEAEAAYRALASAVGKPTGNGPGEWELERLPGARYRIRELRGATGAGRADEFHRYPITGAGESAKAFYEQCWAGINAVRAAFAEDRAELARLRTFRDRCADGRAGLGEIIVAARRLRGDIQ